MASLIALASDYRASDALASVHPWVPRDWQVTTYPTPWGAAVTSGPAIVTEDELVFLGAAGSDPWGLPGMQLEGRTVLRRFARYGPYAAQLASGPFIVADLRNGTLVGASNSIVPIYQASGARLAVGTHPSVVAALAGVSVSRRVPPGTAASIGSAVLPITDFRQVEALPRVTLAGLDREVAHQIRRLGPTERQRIGWSNHGYRTLRLRNFRGSLVAAPRLAPLAKSANPLGDLAAIRSLVGQLWWWAGLRHMNLFVPTLERPAVDTMMLGLRIAGD